MTGTVILLLTVISLGVFLAHAFDACRTGGVTFLRSTRQMFPSRKATR
jgi:hypothetical protein